METQTGGGKEMTTEGLVAKWTQFVKEIQSTNSRLIKSTIINNYHQSLRKLWQYVFDPLITTGMTVANILKFSSRDHNTKRRKIETHPAVDTKNFNEDELIEFLEDLKMRTVTGHAALERAWRWLEHFPENHNELILLFGGKPKLGIDIKLINKVLVNEGKPQLCELFSVALAQTYNSATFKPGKDTWYISRKYDGVRVLLFVDATGIVAKSRNGNPLPSLQEPLNEIWRNKLMPMKATWPHTAFVMDGEMCVMSDDGKTEDFAGAVSQLRQTKTRVDSFRYYFFDILSRGEFVHGSSKRKWNERMYPASQVLVGAIRDARFVSLETEIYTDESFGRWSNRQKDGLWEGLMLRRNCNYVGDRTTDLLKVKQFHTAEYVVCDITIGKKNMLNKSNVMQSMPVMAAVVVQHKGEFVYVGSGFSDEQRLEFMDHPERIIGKTIEVQYFEETFTNGKYSLRFPTLKHIWDKPRDL